MSFAETLLGICVRFIEAEIDQDNAYVHKEDQELLEEIHLSALEFIKDMIRKAEAMPFPICLLIHDFVINKLQFCIHQVRLSIQPPLLRILHIISAFIHQTQSFEQIHPFEGIQGKRY